MKAKIIVTVIHAVALVALTISMNRIRGKTDYAYIAYASAISAIYQFLLWGTNLIC